MTNHPQERVKISQQSKSLKSGTSLILCGLHFLTSLLSLILSVTGAIYDVYRFET
jgi:uncharacterized membrane protein